MHRQRGWRDVFCYALIDSQKEDRDDHPGQIKNPNCVLFHARIILVGSGDAGVGDVKGRK